MAEEKPRYPGTVDLNAERRKRAEQKGEQEVEKQEAIKPPEEEMLERSPTGEVHFTLLDSDTLDLASLAAETAYTASPDILALARNILALSDAERLAGMQTHLLLSDVDFADEQQAAAIRLQFETSLKEKREELKAASAAEVLAILTQFRKDRQPAAQLTLAIAAAERYIELST